MTQNYIIKKIDKYIDNNEFSIEKVQGDKVFYIIDATDNTQRLTDLLDRVSKYDIDYGYSDEYSTCYECGRLIRTSPDSYSWVQDYFISEEGIFCQSCVLENKEYLETYLNIRINSPRQINTLITPERLIELGFRKVGKQEYESGYYGKEDLPEIVHRDLRLKHKEVLFSMIESQQFVIFWEVYVRD